MTDTLTITQPDDWHIHLRDNDALPLTVGDVSHQFARAVVMPNLAPPVTTTEAAQAYRTRILDQIPAGQSFEPLMTLYLTDRLSTEELTRAKESGIVHGVKLYPRRRDDQFARRCSKLKRHLPLISTHGTH